MITTLLTACILLLVAAYVSLIKLFKKTKLYKQVHSLRQALASAPQELRSKRDVRKYRKLRPYIKSLRKKALLVTTIQVLIFLLVYTGSLIITQFIAVIFNTFIIESPIGIPFLSFLDQETGYFVIPVYVNMILVLTSTLYFFMREARIE